MTQRVMVDIETLSTKPDALILSIGAIAFDDYGMFGAPFYFVIDRECQKERRIDIGTVEWWMLPENRDAYPIVAKNSMFLSETLHVFSDWVTVSFQEMPEFWAKGTDFDFVILRDAYHSLGITVPWPYNAIRDLRTVLKLAPKESYTPKEKNPEAHNALGDARFQAAQLLEVMEWQRKHNANSTVP